MSQGRILVVDDDRESCEMLEEALTLRGFSVAWRTGAAAALEAAQTAGPFDVVLTDLRMGGSSGLELCKALNDHDPALPVIVITAFGSIQTAVEAMRAGSFDFITKPFDLDIVALSLERAVRHHRLRTELAALRGGTSESFEGIVGNSQAMRKVFETLARLGASDSTVLITGESGTGKELAARALHARSPRAQKPFLAVNCAAIPEALLESELFGHAKGAFTDARSDRPGLFARAHGGTLFLDEVGEMSMAMQAKLLRALQERATRPVGSEKEVPFDARIIAATNRDLEAEVAAGRFRGDLFFRIHVIELLLPPLRARGSDVLVLAAALIARHAARLGRPQLRLSHEAAQQLLAYDWPGNVRELENCMERAVALVSGDEISVADLPERVRRGVAKQVLIRADEPDELVSLDEMERRYILRVLRAVDGNKKLAAQILGLDRSTLYRKLERYAAPA
ncbi:MAG TPA: sigma-54 dependent transcriptional regulator [Polyangiales bacterium]